MGESTLPAGGQQRVRDAIDRGNRGNMLRAAAFADPAGPARWGLHDHVVVLHPETRVTPSLDPA